MKPEKWNVNCSFRNLTSVPQHGLPHNATGFDLSHNRIRDLPDRVFSQFRNLTYLDLSNNLLHNLSIDVFVGLDNLQHLDLSQNDLPLSNESYPPGVFRELSTSLTQLRLEGNCLAGMWNFQSKETGVILNYPDKALSDLTSLESLSVDGLPDVEFGLGFDSLTRLQNLSLSGMGGGYCVVNILRNETLHHLPASLQVLRMANCNISNIEPDAFRTLQNLELLDLSHNPDLGFDTLGEAFFSLQGSSLKELRIGSIVQPYEMFVTVTVHQTRYFKNTVLEAIHAEFNRIQFFCRGALDNMPRTLSYVNVFGNQLSFGAYIQDIHKLANLTYVQGDGRRLASPLPDYYPSREPVECGSGRQHDDEDEQSFEFDAFVSYASEDNDFVRGELIERLETRAGLRLNVHNRDWIPGRPIPSNILAAVQSSRRTLVVLTRHLLDSDWCEYEMQMATMEAVYTGRDVLLFLLYEDVPSHELPRQVLYNIQSSTYIQYPSHDHADTALVDNFWQRLAQAIRD
nr:hypothetical protein BaRGS_002185 [Batillaria attramentaria]